MTRNIHIYIFNRLNQHHPVTWKPFKNYSPVAILKCKKHILHQPFSSNHNSNHSNNFSNHKKGLLALGLITASSVPFFFKKKNSDSSEKEKPLTPGKFIENLPLYKENDISNHSTKETGIWVTYKNGVYDITDFVQQHPGGNKILLAAGSSIEPFWALYSIHHTEEVYEMLEQYRIGNIEIDTSKAKESEKSSDPYSKDPKRHPVLKAASVKPYNAEPPPGLLVDSFHTPNPIFYVRNHLPVPEVDVKNYTLEISGKGIKETKLSLDDLKKFPKHTISAVVQCAGNRRTEMSNIKTVKGLGWGHAAIGNATWSGAKLTDVLKSCGLNLERTDIEHVQFEGLDKGPEGVPYGASVPAEKALDPKGDVLLAYEMNGEPLPRDHGYPVRVIVPGIVGARNVKWVSKVVLSEKESDSHWQQNDYKGFNPSVDWDTVDFKTAPAIQELPVISAICVPEEGEKVDVIDGRVVVKGYAWSGGGKRIVRVDVTADKGKTWHVADLEQTNDKASRHWSWTLWTINVPVSDKDSTIEIWAKAVDSSYNTQPENIENIWNLRGVLNNTYHKVKVNTSNQ